MCNRLCRLKIASISRSSPSLIMVSGDIVFYALAFKRKKSFINGKAGRKTNTRLAIGSNEFHLPQEALLAGDLPVHPALFPLPPNRQGVRFEYPIGGITSRNRPVEITEDLGRAGTASPTEIAWLERDDYNPFKTAS